MSQNQTGGQRRPRRFAPLNAAHQNGQNGDTLQKLRGIVFDVDGTLCLPQNYMFREMRAALDIPKSVDILDHVRSLSTENDDVKSFDLPDETSSPRSRADAAIQAIERNAMSSQKPQPGLEKLMSYLSSQGIQKALCTRNFPLPVNHLLETFIPNERFDPIITRETEGIMPKPSPEGIWRIAEAWNLHLDVKRDDEGQRLSKAEDAVENTDLLELARRHLGAPLIMVGDSIDDMAAGYRAGAATVLVVNEENEALATHDYTDLSVKSLDELVDVLEKGFCGRS